MSVSEPTDPRKLRPWYVVATMVILWIGGVTFAMRGCSEVSYLRGDDAFRKSMDGRLAGFEAPPVRAALLRERAWLDATGEHHRRAFPLAIAKLLLAILLVLAAGAVLAGRPARSLLTQALIANAAFVVVAFALLTPVRREAVEAAARAATEDEAAAKVLLAARPGEMTEEATLHALREEYAALELHSAGFELSLCLLGLLAITRQRARRYFTAIEAPVADLEGS